MRVVMLLCFLLGQSRAEEYLEKIPADAETVVTEVKKAILDANFSKVYSRIHETKGFSFFKVDEMGTTTSKTNWTLSKSEAENSVETPQEKELKTKLVEAKAYILAEKKTYYLRRANKGPVTEFSSTYRKSDGHHAGNFKGFEIQFELSKGQWEVVGFAYPFDYTP